MQRITHLNVHTLYVVQQILLPRELPPTVRVAARKHAVLGVYGANVRVQNRRLRL